MFSPVLRASRFWLHVYVREPLPTRIVFGWSRFVERESSMSTINLNHARLGEPTV